MRVAFSIDRDGVPVVATSDGKIIIATTGDELREITRTGTWTPIDLDTDTITVTEWMGGTR